MPRISEDQAGQNLRAFLDMIAVSELGERMLNDPKSDDGYKIIVGSVPGALYLFNDYSDHPRKRVFIKAIKTYSTAAGRYQLLSRYFDAYKASLHLPDFSPLSQDLIAIQQIREQKALSFINDGNLAEAIKRVSNIWASLPGNNYGQHQNKIDHLRLAYLNAGGQLA